MRKIKEIGTCPNCDCTLTLFKTSNYKRFVKCEICGLSYAVPKRGIISNSLLQCPKHKVPILIIEKPDQKVYFWADQACFGCVAVDNCERIEELVSEFKDLKVYGY